MGVTVSPINGFNCRLDGINVKWLNGPHRCAIFEVTLLSEKCNLREVALVDLARALPKAIQDEINNLSVMKGDRVHIRILESPVEAVKELGSSLRRTNGHCAHLGLQFVTDSRIRRHTILLELGEDGQCILFVEPLELMTESVRNLGQEEVCNTLESREWQCQFSIDLIGLWVQNSLSMVIVHQNMVHPSNPLSVLSCPTDLVGIVLEDR